MFLIVVRMGAVVFQADTFFGREKFGPAHWRGRARKQAENIKEILLIYIIGSGLTWEIHF